MESEKKSTDPQQSEIDGNVLGKAFESIAGDTEGRQEGEDKPSASQTAGVDDEGEDKS
jgi:hypothetical protein